MTRASSSLRRGFTLIEMLVVIGIILLLASILTVAVVGFVGNAKEAATQATIKKLQGHLQNRIDAYNRMDLRGKEFEYDSIVGGQYRSLSNDPTAQKVLVRKGLFRRYFPQTWSEAQKLLELSNNPLTPPTSPNADTESAEVLYFIITQSAALGFPPEGTEAFTTAEYADTDNNGAKEFIDAWGKPLRFYRWPTRLIKPDGNNVDTTTARVLIASLPTTTQELQRDPDDPTDATHSYNSMNGFEADFHTHETYHVPLIVSGGPDNDTGLFEPNDSSNFGRLACPDSSRAEMVYDNVTNLNQRSGGK